MKRKVLLFTIVCLPIFYGLKAQTDLYLSIPFKGLELQINGKKIDSSSHFVHIKSEDSMQVLLQTSTKPQALKTIQFKSGKRFYVLTLNHKKEYKWRYRDSITSLSNPITYFINDFPFKGNEEQEPNSALNKSERATDSFINQLNQVQFEFDKTMRIIEYLDELEQIDIELLAKLCTILEYDFNKWQICEKFLSKVKDPENHVELTHTFANDYYKVKITDYFKSELD